MLTKHIIGYVPSFIVPALTAFATVYFYTRLLSPEEYGQYTLTTNAMTLLVAVFYSWLQASLPRLMPEAMRQGRALQLRATSHIMFIALGVLTTVVVALLPLGGVHMVMWPALLLTLARSLLNLNEAFHRANLDFRRYNLIECAQAVIGLSAGLALVYFSGLGARGAIMGLLFGMVVMALVDLPQWFKAPFKEWSPEACREILHFGLPLVVGFGLSVVVSTSDRFLIEYFQGPGQVGIYAAGYTLADRLISIVFLMIAIPSLPLTVHRLEREGFEAARDQTYRNGVAAMLLALPACVGLILARHQIINIFIGPAFRDGALNVLPWIAVSGLFNGLSTHYFDHAFHLGKKTRLFIFTLGPAAFLNVALNVILIPRYGYIAAAWSTLAAYVLLLGLSATVGRRVFPVRFPFGPALRIAGAVALMAIAIRALPFPETLMGLIAMVAFGGLTYGLGLLLFNVIDARARVLGILHKGRYGN